MNDERKPAQGQTERALIVKQFRDPAGNLRQDTLKRQIADSARLQPAELARLLKQWLHEDD